MWPRTVSSVAFFLGHYFIDMDPTYFGRIMSFLRSGKLSYRGLDTPDDVDAFHHVLDYFQLLRQDDKTTTCPKDDDTTTHALITWDPTKCGEHLTLDISNRMVVGSHTHCGWQSVQSAQPCTRFRVKVVQRGVIMIGFAPRKGFQANGGNSPFAGRSCGWYVYVMGGTLWAQGGIHEKAYAGDQIQVGSVVTAIYERSQDRIRFEVDGMAIDAHADHDEDNEELMERNHAATSVAFRNLPPQMELFATVDMFKRGRIELVHDM
jgi:hypothetical protein